MFIVTYVCILTSKRSMVGYRFHFAALGTLSYCSPCGAPIASVYGLVPIIFGAIRSMGQLLRTV
jgi:hypothetical protein